MNDPVVARILSNLPDVRMLQSNKVPERMKPFVSEWNKLKEEDSNRIILVKIGKFYEVYAADAMIFHVNFKAPLMNGQLPNTAIPEKSLMKYTALLAEKTFTWSTL